MKPLSIGVEKPKTVRLECPAFSKDKCNRLFEYNPDELDADLKAQGDLLLHIHHNHNFYWKRQGKKLVTRYSKQYAMRNK